MAQSRIDLARLLSQNVLTHSLERLHELAAQRCRTAEALCLEWPQARSKRRVGQPDALYEQTRSDRLLPAETIVPPEPGALPDHVMSSRLQALGGMWAMPTRDWVRLLCDSFSTF